MREGLIEIVQSEAFAPIHVRSASQNRNLRLVADNTDEDLADAVNETSNEESVGETALEAVYVEEPPANDEGEGHS